MPPPSAMPCVPAMAWLATKVLLVTDSCEKTFAMAPPRAKLNSPLTAWFAMNVQLLIVKTLPPKLLLPAAPPSAVPLGLKDLLLVNKQLASDAEDPLSNAPPSAKDVALER